LPEELKDHYIEATISLLERMSDGGKRLTPVRRLRPYLRHTDCALSDLALRAYVRTAGKEAFEEFASLLQCTLVELRRRGVEGTYTLWLASEKDAELRLRLSRLLGAFAEREESADIARLALRYVSVMEGRSEAVPPDMRKVARPRMFACGGGTLVTGWRPVLQTPIERPYWSE
jgi:hypothetical protein